MAGANNAQMKARGYTKGQIRIIRARSPKIASFDQLPAPRDYQPVTLRTRAATEVARRDGKRPTVHDALNALHRAGKADGGHEPWVFIAHVVDHMKSRGMSEREARDAIASEARAGRLVLGDVDLTNKFSQKLLAASALRMYGKDQHRIYVQHSNRLLAGKPIR